MPLSPIPEENTSNNNSSRTPFKHGIKKTKNTNTYKYLQSYHPEIVALLSTLNVKSNFVPSNATRKAARKAAKKVRQAAARAEKEAKAAANSAAKSSKKSSKKRTRKNRR